jgi:DNA-binding CsgD family transcriptional regulator
VGELQALGASLTNRDVPRQLAEHLREHTGGSPLHVRSLLVVVPAERLAQGADAPLPAPQAFSAQVLSRLAASPPDAQRLVVAASVLGERCPLALARRLADIDDPLTALEGAMSARLLDEHESGGERHIAFPHALVRSAVYHDLGPARRAALHRRAAELLEDEAASLQHRAAAAPDHDDGLAADLADYARREADRGAWARAAAAMLRASRLTPVGEQREQRLLEAVDCLLAAGNTAEALSFGAEIDGFADGPHKRLVQGRLAWFAGHTSDGEKLLKTAWDLCDATGDRLLSARIALEVATLLIRRARGEELITWSRRALAAASGSRDARAGLGPFAFGAVYAGRAAEGPEEFADLPEAPADFGAGDVFALSGRGYLRLVTDDLRAARADWSAAAATAELWGPLYIRVAALGFLAMTEFRLGAWDDAIMHAELGSVLGDNHAQQHIVTVPHLAAAATLAARGDWAAARAHAEACARVISEEVTTADAAISAALISAAQADHRGVIDALVPFSQLPMDTGVGEPGTRWPWRELSADALVGLGRADEAEAILTPFEQLAARRGRHSAMANAARVRGNLEAARGRIAEADASYIAGFEHAGKVAIPFDVARLEAAYGTFLRRSRRRTEAVSHLTAARERFARLGAGPYLERCERELATCGVARGRSREPDRSKLTTQELSVARLVAAGMSNPRVAAELYVSINTVEFHLKNVYGKLGIRSRSQLAERLAN